ncbi:hypothetical protein GIB67_018846 [Kingdonia uniflora]|uniref:Cystinosin homolog n=1 Tax=Kingdonia uniflora TaxID=39325 RepID=A0A7J7NEK3_9MAGN|nr:hypothetical protein GIB67_018846 [Kingdonia uniflora]
MKQILVDQIISFRRLIEKERVNSALYHSRTSQLSSKSSDSLGEQRNGVLEFDSARNRLPSIGLGCFHLLVFQLIPSSNPKLQKKKMIPVAANDVAFSMHAVLLVTCMLCQVLIYERGNQKVSWTCIAITCTVWVSAAVCVFIALPNHSWLWLISIFNIIQVTMTAIKYYPQVVMNFGRKSTVGWSIVYILLDILGGVTNCSQMVMQSLDRGSWVNLYGNMGKTLLSLVTIFYDLIFLFQHYVLYPSKKEKVSTKVDNEITDPLMTSFGVSQSEHE